MFFLVMGLLCLVDEVQFPLLMFIEYSVHVRSTPSLDISLEKLCQNLIILERENSNLLKKGYAISLEIFRCKIIGFDKSLTEKCQGMALSLSVQCVTLGYRHLISLCLRYILMITTKGLAQNQRIRFPDFSNLKKVQGKRSRSKTIYRELFTFLKSGMWYNFKSQINVFRVRLGLFLCTVLRPQK